MVETSAQFRKQHRCAHFCCKSTSITFSVAKSAKSKSFPKVILYDCRVPNFVPLFHKYFVLFDGVRCKALKKVWVIVPLTTKNLCKFICLILSMIGKQNKGSPFLMFLYLGIARLPRRFGATFFMLKWAFWCCKTLAMMILSIYYW